jgi:hypothetical protein
LGTRLEIPCSVQDLLSMSLVLRRWPVAFRRLRWLLHSWLTTMTAVCVGKRANPWKKTSSPTNIWGKRMASGPMSSEVGCCWVFCHSQVLCGRIPAARLSARSSCPVRGPLLPLRLGESFGGAAIYLWPRQISLSDLPQRVPLLCRHQASGRGRRKHLVLPE